MAIKGIENMTSEELVQDLERGGKFVVFTYCISVVVMTFQRPTKSIYYVKSNESAISHGWPYLLLTFFLGWWGIPWGPIYSIGSIVKAFKGDDVTGEVLQLLSSECQSPDQQ